MNNTLKITTPSDLEILITRYFDAPRENVFAALTQPDLLKRWLTGPPGWSLVVCDIDLKVDGLFRYVWRKDDGTEIGLSGSFCEIVAPERTVHTEMFDQDWTEGETVVTTLFIERDGKTELSTTIRYKTQEGRDGALKSGMADGMAYGYDLLEQTLGAFV